MTMSNLEFYKNSQEVLARRFPDNFLYIAKCLRIAEVVRYNPETVNMGSTVEAYDRVKFESDFDGLGVGVLQVMTHAWYMDIAGTEYMLELIQPSGVGVKSEVFKLQTDTWCVKFKLRPQNLNAAASNSLPMLKYMNQFAFLGPVTVTGSIKHLESNVTMFALISADLEPKPIKIGI
jgi:hypothetical protein